MASGSAPHGYAAVPRAIAGIDLLFLMDEFGGAAPPPPPPLAMLIHDGA